MTRTMQLNTYANPGELEGPDAVMFRRGSDASKTTEKIPLSTSTTRLK
jgi:hypothetical protein